MKINHKHANNNHRNSRKKSNVQTSVGKVMAGVFRESEKNLLLEFFATGATFNSERYMRALKSYNDEFEGFGQTGT